MKVRATQLGYYDLKRRKEGDVFTLKDIKGKDAKGQPFVIPAEKQFSARWMEPADSAKPSKSEKRKEKEEDETTI